MVTFIHFRLLTARCANRFGLIALFLRIIRLDK
jgi:hypothetical protein